MMDCDATQAISFSDEESDETDQETGPRRQVAVLKVLTQKDLPETQQPIFEGENYIGRHESNSVHLPYKALSKQHACIEVDGDTHLIYDMGSRNRTRRGKMFLKPSIRYQLTDNDLLIFGDVRCQYQFYSRVLQEASDSGSETDSELMFQPPDSKTVHSEDENENDSSFNINDVLQPTQAAVDSPKLQFKTPQHVSSSRVFAAESDDESPNKSSANDDGDVSFIPDTQVSAKKKGSVSIVEESDSDTDIEGEGTAHFNVSDIAAAQTQAVENMTTQAAIDNMATQAIDNMATQAVDTTQAIDNAETQAIDNISAQAMDNIETQAINTIAIDSMETQAIGSLSSDVAMENAATLPVHYKPDSDTDIDEAGPTLFLEASTVSSEQDRTPARQVRNLFDEPTQPCGGQVSDSDSDTDIDNLEADAETQAVTANASHLHIQDDMATVPITEEDDDDDETDEEKDAPGSKPDGGISHLANIPTRTDNDDVTDNDEDHIPKQPVNKSLLDVENMATVPVTMDEDDDDITDEEGDNVDKQTKKEMPSDIENMATIPMSMDEDDDITDDEGGKVVKQISDKPLSSDIENMATIPIATEDDSDTDMSEEEAVDHLSAVEETQALDDDVLREDSGHDHDDDKQGDVEQESKSSEPVLVKARPEGSIDAGDQGERDEGKKTEGDVENDEEKQKGRGREEQKMEEGGKEKDDDDVIAFTQPYGTSSGEHLEEGCYEATQPYGNEEKEDSAEMEATQQYGGTLSPPQSPDGEEEIAMETEDSEVEATQAYGEQSSDTQVPDSQEDSVATNMSSRFPLPTNHSPVIGSSRSLVQSAKSPTEAITAARSSRMSHSVSPSRSPAMSPTVSPTKSCLKPADKQKSAKSTTELTTTARFSTMSHSASPSRSPALSPTTSPTKSCLKPADKSAEKTVRSRRVTFESPEDVDNQMEEESLQETSTKRNSKSTTKKREVKPSEVVTGSSRLGRKSGKDRQNKTSNENEEQEAPGRRSARRAGKETDTNDGNDKKQSGGSNDAENNKVRSRRKVTVQDDETDTKHASPSAAGRGKRTRGDKESVETDAGPTRKRSLAENKFSSSLIQTSKKEIAEGDKQTEKKIASSSQKGTEQDDKLAESSMSSPMKEGETKKKVKPLAKLKKTLTTMGTRGRPKAEKTTGAITGKGETEEPRTRRSKRVKTQTEKDAEVEDSDETASLSSTASSMKDLTEVDSVGIPEPRLSIAEQENPRAGRSARSSRRSAQKLDSDFVYETPRATRNRNDKNTEEKSEPDGRVNISESISAEVKRSNKKDKRGVSKDSQSENVTSEQTLAPSTRTREKRGSSKDVESKPEEQEQTPAPSTRKSRRVTGTSESQEELCQPKRESKVRQSGRGKKQETAAKEQSSQSQDEVSPSRESQKSVQEMEDTIFAIPKPVSRTTRQKKNSESSTVQEPSKKETKSRASASGSQNETETESQNERTSRGRRSTSAAKTSNKNNQIPGKNSGEAPSSDNFKDSGTDSQNERTSRGRRSAAAAKQPSSKREEATVLASEEESSESNPNKTSIELRTPRGRRTTATNEISAKKEKVLAPEGTPETFTSGKDATVPDIKELESSKTKGKRTSKKEEQQPPKQESKSRSKRGAVEEPQASPAKKSRPPTHHTLTPSAAQPTGLAASHLSPTSSPSQASRHRTDAAAAHSPSLRRRGSEARPKVMFTGVTDESWMKTVTSLGGELVDSVSDCSHLITDKVRRTVKFLCCVAQGTIIVTPDWLQKSKSSKVFVDPAPYQLHDKAAEKQHGFSLSASLQKAGEGQLFKGYHIHVTPGVKPEPTHMKDIIRCAGGQYASKLPSKANGQQTVVVSCDADKSVWAGAAKVGIPVVSSEFILTGILRQEVMLSQYKLK